LLKIVRHRTTAHLRRHPSRLQRIGFDLSPAPGKSKCEQNIAKLALGVILEEFDALTQQLIDPGIEIGDTERDVILELPARTDQRLVALKVDPAPAYGAARNFGRFSPLDVD
jgi:hypothetical protein